MYLKSIELQGFKSFPDRTKLSFERGATVIVGPNGSGKSNIADAMRWVLGEISSKSLRGTKMEDIIFGGSDSRKPMTYAEVSVTFDNTASGGHIDVPYDEITVTRRYHRNGDSEYFINRRDCRLRDIYEMFLNTGIGRDGYSIIGQGRIAEIIAKKSDDRRDIFEDAAGIAKYRHKKNDAERKLANTNLNMDRVRDALNIMGGHLASLQRESARARRFVEYSEVKKEADVRLWLYDTDRYRSEIGRAESDMRMTDMELGQITEETAKLTSDQERLDEMTSRNRADAAGLLSRISARTRSNYELDSGIKVLTARIESSEQAAKDAVKNAGTLDAQAAADNAEAEAGRAEAESLAGEAEKLAAEEKELTGASEKAGRKAAETEDAMAAAFDEIAACRAEVSDADARLELLGKSESEEDGRDEAARRDLKEREKTALEHSEMCREIEESISGYSERSSSLHRELDALRAEEETLRTGAEQDTVALNAATVKADTLAGRIEALKRMEEHFEGYNNSVKHVMQSYRDGAISGGNARCGEIYGPVSSLISVRSEYVTAIEVALGAAIQNIVVDNEETARAAIYCLRRDNAGRATFFPLTSAKPSARPRDLENGRSYAGYVGVASELVSVDPKYSNVISSMLGRTAVFDTLENATAMEKKCGYSVRAVTLDGQQINRDGSFTGGSMRTSSGILTRADEIKRLGEQLKTERAAEKKYSSSLEIKNSRLEKLSMDISSKDSEAQLIDTLRAVEQAKLEKQRETVAADTELLAKFRQDIEEAAGEKEKRQAEIAALELRKKELAEKIEELGAFRTESDARHGELLQEQEDKRREAVKLTVRITELRRDAESRNALAELSRSRAAETAAAAASAREQAEQYTANAAAMRDELNRAVADFAAGEKELESFNEKRTEAEKVGFEYERKSAEIRRLVQDRSARKDVLVNDKIETEKTLANLRSQLDSLSSRFWDEHGMTREEALACNYAPLTKEERPSVIETQTEYRNKLRNVGNCDPASIELYAREKEKYDELSSQLEDLEKSKADLEKVISQLEVEMEKAFTDAFDRINENFKKTFSELFGGGSAELQLTDPSNVLESGIEIKAAPPGKIIKSLMQLSGGEQSFVAVALFFAILQANPTPFCILDEVEAALDEVNVDRFAQYIRRYSDDTQFILITHRRGTMNAADTLYGVTMPESGISKVISVDVREIAGKKGEFWDELS